MPEWRSVPNRSAKRDANPDDHHERNHQGLGNDLTDGEQQDLAGAGRNVRRERLGGLPSFHHRKMARQERTE
jgi:hypothetical protein